MEEKLIFFINNILRHGAGGTQEWQNHKIILLIYFL